MHLEKCSKLHFFHSAKIEKKSNILYLNYIERPRIIWTFMTKKTLKLCNNIIKLIIAVTAFSLLEYDPKIVYI